jgi:hypothetical protein
MRQVAVLALLLGSAPVAAQQVNAQQVDADQAMANFRRSIDTPVQRCPGPDSAEEVVVCAQRPEEDRFRAPLFATPDERPGARAGGEQRAAMAQDDQRCTPIGRAQQCGGGLPIFAIAAYVIRNVVAIIQGDE